MTFGALAWAIARAEGYPVSGSRPQRNRNPGDLRAWPGVPRDKDGFSIFPSDEAGFRALITDLRNHARAYPDQTLAQFVGGDGAWPGYAPASDGNDPEAYAANLARWLGCQTSFRMGELS
ncbi:MAG: hypothetical protein ACRD13_10290 [Terriglobales bacterium]